MTPARTPAEALEPCPFCGSAGLLHRVANGWTISCEVCCASPRTRDYRPDKAAAAAFWNKRAAALSTSPARPDREAVGLLRRIEPFIDSIVCYASSVDEHEPNKIAVDLRSYLALIPSGIDPAEERK